MLSNSLRKLSNSLRKLSNSLRMLSNSLRKLWNSLRSLLKSFQLRAEKVSSRLNEHTDVFIKLAEPDKDPHRLLASDQCQDDSIVHSVQTFHLASF